MSADTHLILDRPPSLPPPFFPLLERSFQTDSFPLPSFCHTINFPFGRSGPLCLFFIPFSSVPATPLKQSRRLLISLSANPFKLDRFATSSVPPGAPQSGPPTRRVLKQILLFHFPKEGPHAVRFLFVPLSFSLLSKPASKSLRHPAPVAQ